MDHLSHRSLVVKSVLLTLFIGAVAAVVVNLVVSRLVEEGFREQLKAELQQNVATGRAHFDGFVKLHFELAKVITERKRFSDHVRELERAGAFVGTSEVKELRRQPRWLPRRSTLRRFAKATYYVLLDGEGRAIEYYRDSDQPLPERLLEPPFDLIVASRHENFMTDIGDTPFLISSTPVRGALRSDGGEVGNLLLATPIDDRLLSTIQVATPTRRTVALTTGIDPRIIATSDPELLPNGARLEALKERFLVFSAPVFNYEYSDLLVTYNHFVERETVNQLSRPIVQRERLYQSIAFLVLTLAFALFVLRFAGRVQRLSNQVSHFSRHTLGATPLRGASEDQLDELEHQFHTLAREVEAANREQAALRQAILASIPNPLFYCNNHGRLLGCNRAFEQFTGLEEREWIGRPQPAELIQEELLTAGGEAEPAWELEWRRGDVGRRTLLVHRATFRNRDDSAAGSVVTLTDISESRRAADEIRALNQELEARVTRRTAELQSSLDDLRATQNQLVEAEKMASLGELVAGVAHEINTPVGIGVTAASHLQDATEGLSRQLEGGLRRSQLDGYLESAGVLATTILNNLLRASELIRGFKEVAVDRSSEQRRRFELDAYLEEVLSSLRPKIKHTRHRATLRCPPHLEMDSYPGALAQVVTNLFMNALIHGFDGIESGHFELTVEQQGERLRLHAVDDGRGMRADEVARIFDPFYTTRRGQGGSGLGMHIVYNLVTRTLGGTIECYSEWGAGSRFEIVIPRAVEERPLEADKGGDA